MSNTLNNSGLERLFGIAFELTVETGYIPISLAERFNTINSNIELAKMIQNVSLNIFWHQNNNIFTSQLVMSNQLCHLTGVPINVNSLIVTLSHSNLSKCIIFDHNMLNKKCTNLSIKYKNVVCLPIKCAILEITMNGQYPCLCGISTELILYIMEKLDTSDLYALMRSNRKMNYLAINNQILWKKLVIKEFKNVELNQRNQSIQPITDWRKYYYELRREKFGRKRTIMIRE